MQPYMQLVIIYCDWWATWMEMWGTTEPTGWIIYKISFLKLYIVIDISLFCVLFSTPDNEMIWLIC